MSLLSYLGFGQRASVRSTPADRDRLADYARYLRAYRGYRSGIYDSNATTAAKAQAARKVRFNFNRPIVNLGAAFLAAKPLQWKVDGNDVATEAAFEIWDRSGSDRVFLDAARSAGIYGDVVGLTTQDEQERPRLEFVCADICFPTFDGSDSSRLVELEITWQEEDRRGRQVTHREFYTETGRQVFVDGEEITENAQQWDAIPAQWIRNLTVKGLPFGLSDLEGVVDLVEEYDHIAAKRGQMIDYYAAPTIVFEGTKKGDVEKDTQTMFFLPVGAKAYFLEWSGTAPDVETHLTRIRNDIAEVSQVPAVAFGRQDSGFSSISGVAVELLHGPLLAKVNDKRASWSPPLEYLMWLALKAEGHGVALEQVNVRWLNPLPEDVMEKVNAETTALKAGVRSVETAIHHLGSEDPAAELKRIQQDQRWLRLKTLTDAGADLHSAALTAGFTEEEANRLAQTDTPTTIQQ